MYKLISWTIFAYWSIILEPRYFGWRMSPHLTNYSHAFTLSYSCVVSHYRLNIRALACNEGRMFKLMYKLHIFWTEFKIVRFLISILGSRSRRSIKVFFSVKSAPMLCPYVFMQILQSWFSDQGVAGTENTQFETFKSTSQIVHDVLGFYLKCLFFKHIINYICRIFRIARRTSLF